MHWMSLFAVATFVLAGCIGAPSDLATSSADSDGDGYIDSDEVRLGSDPLDPLSRPVELLHEPIAFSETASGVVGTGAPGVQCPADAVNSKVLIWTINAPAGATEVHVADVEVTMTSPATMNDADLFVYSPSGKLLGSAVSGAASETVTFGKQTEVGDYQIEVRGCSGTGDVAIEATGLLGYLAMDGHANDGHQHG